MSVPGVPSFVEAAAAAATTTVATDAVQLTTPTSDRCSVSPVVPTCGVMYAKGDKCLLMRMDQYRQRKKELKGGVSSTAVAAANGDSPRAGTSYRSIVLGILYWDPALDA